MSVKLMQLAKELNVGVSSLTELLSKSGKAIDHNPNAKIGKEDFDFILTQMSSMTNDMGLTKEHLEEVQKKFAKKFQSASASKTESEPSKEAPKASAEKVEKKPQELIPEETKPQGVTVVGKIDLNAKKKEKKATEAPQTSASPKAQTLKEEKQPKAPQTETPKLVEEKEQPQTNEKEIAPVPAPKAEDKQDDPKATAPETKITSEKEPSAVKQEPEQTEQAIEKKTTAQPDTPKAETTVATQAPQEPEIFRINTPPTENKIKVLGKIDLSSINESTRPKKKTKEEKKASAEAKQKRKRIKNNAVDVKVEAARVDDASRKKTSSDAVAGGAKNGRPNSNDPRKNTSNKNNPKKEKTKAQQQVDDDAVQRQVKETLARLTGKKNTFGKGAKYRKDKREAARQAAEEAQDRLEMESKVLKLTEFVTVSDLASMMGVQVNDVIATCMSIDMMVSINQRLDAETIKIVAEEFGYETEFVSADVVEAIEADDEDAPESLQPRVPIVTVMGHVDHGKTSLLDTVRNANVISGEAGGITQHIGAYSVTLKNGRKITFLDTPGHEAFTAMRARGAQVTDIAIIIIAADDKVMPQTIEAINHASAAGVPIIFAINKVDRPTAQPDRIREQLSAMNYLVEEWGGKYQCQEISAKMGNGVYELLEKVLLEADLLDLKANPDRKAVGSVIESSLDKGRGYVSTVLVQNGTLHTGDVILAGKYFGRVKAMFNERNQRVKVAGPSAPVLILGFNGAPSAGDKFNVLDTDQEAREIANRREQLQREQGLRTQKMLTLDDIGRRIAIGNFQQLNLIIKGDVDGSVQALSDSLIRLSTPEIQVNVIHQAVGQISESDVVLATASDAIIIGFQVRPSSQARKNAEQEGIEIRTYSIIYDAIEEVKSAMEGMLSPEIKEQVTGNLQVQQVFKISKVGTIAGCLVTEGKIKRTDKIRVIRDGIVVHSGDLSSLKRFKDEVKEVPMGLECGINIKNFNDIQVDDIIESYEEIEIKKTL